MKKFLPLSLLAISCLQANDCCKPCCVPEPKKCIDCECYTPKYYDLQCDMGLFASVDFLYWFARETDLEYAVKVTNVRPTSPLPFGTDALTPLSTQYLDTKWDPGFRVGLGWNGKCDGWDLYLNWTYYHNKKSNSTSVPASYINQGDTRFPAPGQNALINPWLDANSIAATLFSFDRISAHWMLNLNQIDLELGRRFWLSESFSLRPYTGIRGAWTKTTFRTNSFRNVANLITTAVIPIPGPFNFKDQFINHAWGVGILGGIQPVWHFTSNFQLFSNVEAALIFGKLRSRKNELYHVGASLFNNNWHSNYFGMQTILDLALGLRWEETWSCDRYRTALDIGWEQHIWFNFNQRSKTIDPFFSSIAAFNPTPLPLSPVITPPLVGFSDIEKISSDLMLGGLVVRARFDF